VRNARLILIAALLQQPAAPTAKRKRRSQQAIFQSASTARSPASEAAFGTSTVNGVRIAAEEINAAGGVLGRKIRLVVEDDQGRAEEAASVVTKLITSDGVVALIGENSSNQSLAAAPIAQSERRPDDLAVVDESRGHGEGRLHLPRLLHRSLSGEGAGAFVATI
jgi:hypothetical protein